MPHFMLSLKIPFTNPNSHTAPSHPGLCSTFLVLRRNVNAPSQLKAGNSPYNPQNRPWMVGPRKKHQSWTLHNHKQCNDEICFTRQFACEEVTTQRETAWKWKEGGSRLRQLLSCFLFEAAHCQENTADLQGIKCTMKMPPRDGDTLTGLRLSWVLRQLNTSMCAMGPTESLYLRMTGWFQTHEAALQK